MLAIAVNLLAFYFAALIFEHTGIIYGVSAFFVASFAGTIACSKVEEHLARKRASSCDAPYGSGASRAAAAVSLP